MATPDDEIKRLKKELSLTRRHLVGLAVDRSPKPHEMHEALIGSAVRFANRTEMWNWEAQAIETVIKLAVRDKQGLAYCPLCGDGVTSWEQQERGFQWPIGLEMHLRGKGKASQCIVMRTAIVRVEADNYEKIEAAENAAFKAAAIAALAKVKEICDRVGCTCQIVEGTYQAFLYGRGSGHHSLISYAGPISSGDIYHVEAVGRNGPNFIELAGCTADEAAQALIWEHQHPHKRWMRGRA